MFNETMKVSFSLIKYPTLIFESVFNDANTEYYLKIALNILVAMAILLMFFLLLCCSMLLAKVAWVIFNSICYWFFGRDTLKEFLIRQNQEDKEFLNLKFKQLIDEIRNKI